MVRYGAEQKVPPIMLQHPADEVVRSGGDFLSRYVDLPAGVLGGHFRFN